MIMKRMIFGCTLLLCGVIGTLSAWFVRYKGYGSHLGFSVLFSMPEVAVPFMTYLVFFFAGLALCLWELWEDHKKS